MAVDYNTIGEGIEIVIYADILFIINFFITFLILRITARLTKKEAKNLRLIAASALGGLYSMIIFADIPPALSSLSKAAACLVIVLCAFRFYRVKSFFYTVLIFLFSNLLFLGIIIGIYLIFKSDLIAVKNETVYFDIGARGLLLSAVFAYIVSSLAVRLYNRQLSKGEIFTVEIQNGDKTLSLFALADTGNRLREPFSDEGVIVVGSEAAGDMFSGESYRIIPASSVGGEVYMKAYKPDRVTVRSAGKSEVIENVYIALSENIKAEGCSAVLNPEILSV